MATRDIVVIGGSAGSVAVLKHVLGDLPASLSASVFITTQMPVQSPGYLAHILAQTTALPVLQAADAQPIEPGHVYVAATDRHLLPIDGVIRLGTGPRESMARRACMRSRHAANADHVAASGQLGGLIASIVGTPADRTSPASAALHLKVDIASSQRVGSAQMRRIADPNALSCPDYGPKNIGAMRRDYAKRQPTLFVREQVE